MKKDPKTGQWLKPYTEEQFNLLVNVIRTGTAQNAFEYLNQLAKDDRTKYKLLDRAMEEAKTLDMDTK